MLTYCLENVYIDDFSMLIPWFSIVSDQQTCKINFLKD